MCSSDLPTLLPEKAVWIERAEHETAKELRSNIWKRLDEVRGTKTTWPFSANLSEDRWFDLERARALVAKDPKNLPGNDHVLGVLLDTFLDEKDILRQKGGTRRLPDTTGTRGHYIPADVKRIVHGRTRGRCAILKCTNTFFMELVHETADCRGGCREPWNLGLRCSMHHHLKDSEIINNQGTVEEPRYMNRFGEELRCRKPEATCTSGVPVTAEVSRGPPEKNGGLFT